MVLGESLMVRLHSKVKARELACKHLGLLVERIDVSSAGKAIYDVKPFEKIAEAVEVIEEVETPKDEKPRLPKRSRRSAGTVRR